MIVDSDDEELEHHGLAANDFNARTPMGEDNSIQENHELVHNGMTDEEFAQLLQQQEYEQSRRSIVSSSGRNSSTTSGGAAAGTLVDLGGGNSVTSPSSSLREEQDDAYNRSLRLDQERQRQEDLERQRQREEEQQRQREEEARERREQEKLRRRREKASNLKMEPSESETTSIAKVLIRLPDSTRITRRFRYSDTIGDIFDYLEVTKDMDMENYVIVTTFPARRFSIEEHTALTLTQANLAEKQVTLNIAEK